MRELIKLVSELIVAAIIFVNEIVPVIVIGYIILTGSSAIKIAAGILVVSILIDRWVQPWFHDQVEKIVRKSAVDELNK